MIDCVTFQYRVVDFYRNNVLCRRTFVGQYRISPAGESCEMKIFRRCVIPKDDSEEIAMDAGVIFFAQVKLFSYRVTSYAL